MVEPIKTPIQRVRRLVEDIGYSVMALDDKTDIDSSNDLIPFLNNVETSLKVVLNNLDTLLEKRFNFKVEIARGR